MGVDTHVTCCARQRFAFAIGDVLLRFGVSVLLGHTKVDDMDDIGDLGIRATDEEVVRFDVAVDHVFLVDRLHPRQHLLRDHDDSLNREPTITMIEQILETGAQQVNHQDVVQPFLAKVVNVRNSGCDKLASRSTH